MLYIGEFRTRTCSGVTRRSFLRIGAFLPLALGLPGVQRAARAAETANAKSVIFVFLW